jgi:Ran-binding protein 9/10
VGDVIGCGINFWRETIFFTKNGKLLGDAFIGQVGNFFPTVSLHSPGDSVRFNFNGETRKFVFDFEGHVASFKEARSREMQLQPVPSILPLIRNYLTHFGFAQTLISFEKATNSGPASQAEVDPSLRHRKTLRDMIMSGHVIDTIEMTRKLFPGLLTEQRRDVLFRLQCQLFIEFIRGGKLEDAIRLAQEAFREAYTSSTADLITQHTALFCYSNLADAPMQNLLSQEHREETFDVLNEAVLEQSQRSKNSALQILTRHLRDLSERLRATNEFSGSLFDLTDFAQGNDGFCP